ncbi:glutaminyl-peptide cyclotransferase [Streptomyces virginiae]|uniref:glutaminyl-peptide cyclotransferase n=1 Tax=Streptomyces virginiae TaxID=1961 RepID=UPI0033B42C04
MRRPDRSREGAPGRRRVLRHTHLAAAYTTDRLVSDVLSPLARALPPPTLTAALTGCPRPSTTLQQACAGTCPGRPRRDRELCPGSTLNGIAAIPGTDQFPVTGKFWPRMFRSACCSSRREASHTATQIPASR